MRWNLFQMLLLLLNAYVTETGDNSSATKLIIGASAHGLQQVTIKEQQFVCYLTSKGNKWQSGWRLLYGSEKHSILVKRKRNRLISILRLLGPSNSYSPSTFRCVDRYQTFCRSRIVLVARTSPPRAVHYTGEVKSESKTSVACSSDGKPATFNDYRIRVDAGVPTGLVLNNSVLTWVGSTFFSRKNKITCKVRQVYMGKELDILEDGTSTHNLEKISLHFEPIQEYYTRNESISCKMHTLNPPPSWKIYIMLDEYPLNFTPHRYYEELNLSKGFTPGNYKASCHIVTPTMLSESTSLDFNVTEGTKGLFISQVYSGSKLTQLECRAQVLQLPNAVFNWTILKGSHSSFHMNGAELKLTKFAPFDKYEVQCMAKFGFGNKKLQMQAFLNFTYTDKDDKAISPIFIFHGSVQRQKITAAFFTWLWLVLFSFFLYAIIYGMCADRIHMVLEKHAESIGDSDTKEKNEQKEPEWSKQVSSETSLIKQSVESTKPAEPRINKDDKRSMPTDMSKRKKSRTKYSNLSLDQRKKEKIIFARGKLVFQYRGPQRASRQTIHRTKARVPTTYHARLKAYRRNWITQSPYAQTGSPIPRRRYKPSTMNNKPVWHY